MQYGIEIDVAAFAENDTTQRSSAGDWVAAPPVASVPVTMSEATVEVGIFSRTGGPVLAGAIELVSPANKDRPGNRDAFVSKCTSYI